MPLDADGNFYYPLPPKRAGKQPASKPSRRPIVNRQTPNPLETFLQAEIVPPVVILPTFEPEPEPNLALPFANTTAVFSLNEGGNRWQMSELDLAYIWNCQKWPTGLSLATSDGLPVEIVYRGRWSGGLGPDFKGAQVRIGTTLHKGDVELHLRSGDWLLHGHHQDRHYDNVILQIVLEDNQAAKAIPVVALLPLFQAVGAKLADSLAFAKESGTRLGSISESQGPCCERVADNVPDLPNLLARIDQLGEQRFEERSQPFEIACASESPSQALWAGLLEALGYSQNKIAFRRLANILPFEQILELDLTARRNRETIEERLLTLEAALLGSAGLLPSQRVLKSKGQPASTKSFFVDEEESFQFARYTDELENRWQWLQRQLAASGPTDWQILKQADWVFAKLRPPNHPSRRIAGLARLIIRSNWQASNDLLETLAARLRANNAKEACKSLAGYFQVALQGEESDSAAFWTRRYDFSDRAIMLDQSNRAAQIDLIGADRAADIVVNIVLPFLAAYGRDRSQADLTKQAQAVYGVYPKLGSNELIENVAKQVFQHWLNKERKITLASLVNSAKRQQGLIHLHRSFCAEHNFAACPLA